MGGGRRSPADCEERDGCSDVAMSFVASKGVHVHKNFSDWWMRKWDDLINTLLKHGSRNIVAPSQDTYGP